MYVERLARLRSFFAPEKIDALLVSHPPNVRYLSGFRGTDAYLLIGADRQYLIADFRYAEQAIEEAKGFEVELLADSLTQSLNILLSKNPVQRLGFEIESLNLARYRYLRRKLGGLKLRPVAKLVEKLRSVKDEGEIESIARAAELGDRAFKHVLAFIKPGISEREIALELEFFMRRQGSESMGFEVIVASGPSSARPHARTSGKKLKKGEFVKLDFGAVFDGYHSDMTRTVVVGKASKKQRSLYAAVLNAQESVLERLKEGLAASKADRLARALLEKEGLADRFGHNLGHGVGLEIHEAPTLGKKGKEKLMAGMVFTVEPGVYISGFGGVRIEDLVVLRQEGVEILTKFPKELIEL